MKHATARTTSSPFSHQLKHFALFIAICLASQRMHYLNMTTLQIYMERYAWESIFHKMRWFNKTILRHEHAPALNQKVN